MGKIIFILGGARSGKSRYAVELAKKLTPKVAFIATATASDEEMKKRIKLHKISRPQHWAIFEESKDIHSVLLKLETKYKIVIIDCLGLWISNLLLDNLGDKKITKKINEFIDTVSKIKLITILVSNDVGSGIVPDNFLARRFIDYVGSLNEIVAKRADEVIFMHSGIPVKIKGEKDGAKIKWDNRQN